MKRSLTRLFFLAGAAVLILLPPPANAVLKAQGGCATTRVSVASDGTQANRGSADPSISGDGRYVAFESDAATLVPGDTNHVPDVFLHDMRMGQTTLVSLASDGAQGDGGSGAGVSISTDGRHVAFVSGATNLVPGDSNGWRDVFVRDVQTGETTRVSVASDGTQGNGPSGPASISGDGRHVAFVSSATNLVPGDTNGWPDVFVHHVQMGGTARVSVASDGTEGNGDSSSVGPSISADGRYVAFASSATNLVPGDTNAAIDIFVHDTQTGQTALVSVASDGSQGSGPSDWPSISADGRYVAFESWAANLVPGDTNGGPDVFVHDMKRGWTARASVACAGDQGNGASLAPAISPSGRHVAFVSFATNLVPGDTNGWDDVFVHDGGPGSVTYLPLIVQGPSRAW